MQSLRLAVLGRRVLACATAHPGTFRLRQPCCGLRCSSDTPDRDWHAASAAIHADGVPELAELVSTAGDIAPPISMSTTFEAGGSHIYSRISSPTRERCEVVLGAIEGLPGKPAHSVLYSSGLAACFAALAHFQPKRVQITGGYHGTHLVLQLLRRLGGGTPSIVDILPPDQVQHGDLVWLETPSNPTCDVQDISAYVKAVAALPPLSAGDTQARVVVDGTFAPPPMQRPLTLGADCVMHSATKYLAGHSDALCGALNVADKDIAKALLIDRLAIGSQPGNLEVWLLLRSLRTLHVRVERQARSAGELAVWLQEAVVDPSHPLYGHVRAVRHPSLPLDPGYEIAQRQMAPGLYGGCFALELVTEAAAKALPAELKLFCSATSLGGVESLIEWRRQYDDAVSPYLLRVSVGLEDALDLQADLQRSILAVSK